MFELRPYQTQAINEIAQEIRDGNNKIAFQLATGGGKSFTFAGLIDRYIKNAQRKVLLLVHRDELLKQARRTLFDGFDISATPVIAGSTYLPNSMVYVAMVETANNRLKKNPKYFGNIGMVIVDEAHIGVFRKLYDYFPDAIRIGFTATPLYPKKTLPMKTDFQEIVCGIDIPDLIKMGSLKPNRTVDYFNVKRDGIKVTAGEFDEQEMSNIFSTTKHVNNTVVAYKQYARGLKTIVFNVTIAHSKLVSEAFNKAGIACRHLDGETDERQRADTLNWFKNTPGAVLCNVGVLTTGFDEPSIECCLVNRCTKSIPLWLQMTGRGSRPFPGKDFFLILDLGENAKKLGDWDVPRNWKKLFHNPEDAFKDGESPSKKCANCDYIIPAATVTCKYCGHVHQRKDNKFVEDFRIMQMRAPFECNVFELIHEYSSKLKKDGTAYKDTSVLHLIKRNLIYHAKTKWKLKKVNQITADEITALYQKFVEEWCHHKLKHYGTWWQLHTQKLMYEAMEESLSFNNPLKQTA